MLPSREDPRWKMLVQGVKVYNLKSVPAGMMLSRHRRSIARDSSEQNINKRANEVYAFFKKYERILGFDIATIFGEE